MPTRKLVQVSGDGILAGDYWGGQPVVKVRHATKYAYLTVSEHGREVRVGRNDTVSVGREFPTEEELAAQKARRLATQRALFVSQLRDVVDAAESELEAAEEKRHERLAAGWQMLDYSTMDDLFEAWAFVDAVRPVRGLWEKYDAGKWHKHAEGVECEWAPTEYGRKCVAPTIDVDEYEVAVEILKRVYQQFIDRAKQSYRLSRSTSVISNMCDDLLQLGRLQVFKSLRYSTSGLPELEHIELDNIY